MYKSVKERLEQREIRSVKSETGGKVFLAVKYAYDLVFVAREEIMLRGIIPRPNEIGIPMEGNKRGKKSVMKASSQPSAVHIIIDQK